MSGVYIDVIPQKNIFRWHIIRIQVADTLLKK